MRSALVCVIAVGALLGLSGCTPGANDQLKRVVEAALLPGMNSSSCEWGASSFENEPSSWYGCWDYVSGEPVRVGGTIRSQLSSQGFDVFMSRGHLTVELMAVRHSAIVCVDVLAPGFVDGRNTSPEEVDPGPGEVFVDVWTAELRDGSGDACAGLPAWEE